MPSSLVGKRNLQPRGFTTGNTSCTYRLKYPVAVAATNLRLMFPAWTTQAAGTGDTATGNTVTLGAVYVEFGGSLFPVTFSGAASVDISSGASITSDVVSGLSVPAGATLYVRTYVTVASGGQWPNLYGALIYPDEVARPGQNLANSTGDLTGTGQAFSSLYGPSRIYGDVTSPLYAISVLGDSIAAGVNDSFSDETQVGYYQRALYPGSRPYSIVALPGESAAQYLTGAQAASRAGLVGDYAHYLINEYGINDLQGGATLAQLQARVRQIAQTTSSDATLVKRYQQTLGPKTSSTDSWATTANQTTDGINGVRVQFNDWVRDGMPESSGVAVAAGTSGALRAGQAGHPYSGYVEVADLCETARNSGIWKANYTNDGLHPGPTGNQQIAAGLDLTPFADTAASSGGGGSAGLAYVAASSPAIRSSAYQGAAASQAWASNAFSPPAGSLIVVAAYATQSYNNAWNTPTITDSAGLTWTRVDTQADVSVGAASSTVSLFWALCPAAKTNMTVTVTQSLAGSGQTITFSSVDVRVWTGHDSTTPIGVKAKGATTAQNLGVALTPGGSGSALAIVAANQAASSTTTTAGTGEYIAGETHTGSSFVSAWYGTASGPSIPAGAQTLDLVGNAAARWQYIAYEVRGAAATTTTITTTVATSWAVRSRTTSTAVTGWAARSAAAQSTSSTWATRQTTSSSVTSTWQTRRRISTTVTRTWSVRTSTAATWSSTWNVAYTEPTTPVSASTPASWAVRTRTETTSPSQWATRSTATIEAATAWALRQTTAAGYTLAWQTRTATTTATPQVWAVRASAIAARSSSWATRSRTSAASASGWALRTSAATTLVVSWNVQGAPGKVDIYLALAWSTRSTVGSQSSTSWSNRSVATSSLLATWSVRVAAAVAYPQLWRLQQLVLSTSPSAWSTRRSTAQDLATSWAVRIAVVTALAQRWSVAAADSTGLHDHTFTGHLEARRWTGHLAPRRWGGTLA